MSWIWNEAAYDLITEPWTRPPGDARWSANNMLNQGVRSNPNGLERVLPPGSPLPR